MYSMRIIEEELNASEAFLGIARYLASRPPYEVPLGASATATESIKEKHIWWRAVTCHMLYSIVFEAAIKIVWALDYQKDAPHSHNIAGLFGQLSDKSRNAIERIYRDATTAFAQIGGLILEKFGEEVEFDSLDEALVANEETMKNFKYGNRFQGKSSILGSVVWGRETVWTLPSLEGARFPEALYKYAKDRLDSVRPSIGSTSGS